MTKLKLRTIVEIRGEPFSVDDLRKKSEFNVLCLFGTAVGLMMNIIYSGFDFSSPMTSLKSDFGALAVLVVIIFGFVLQLKWTVSMAPVKSEQCPDILAWCDRYETIATYQSKVARLGRELVIGEYDAMQAWVKDRVESDRIDASKKAASKPLSG